MRPLNFYTALKFILLRRSSNSKAQVKGRSKNKYVKFHLGICNITFNHQLLFWLTAYVLQLFDFYILTLQVFDFELLTLNC